MLRAQIQENTAKKASEITGIPLTKGFNSQVEALCDKISQLENPDKVKKLDCLCPESKEVLEQNG